LKIFDILGREVKTLVNREQTAGAYRVEWNGTDNFGTLIPSGMYIYRIVAGDFIQTRKMMFLK
jgi:flagellar hook assembly protein FlgD